MRWEHAGGVLECVPGRPLLMGILNVTPDSFSDGGALAGPDEAAAAGERMLAAGADLLDVGGESTRPGSRPVEAAEERRRVLPVIGLLARRCPRAVISIDTYKTAVAAAALDAGAVIVNDVGAGRWADGMLELVAARRAGYVAMHARGRPEVMQQDPRYGNVVEEVGVFLRERLEAAVRAGLAREAVVLDTGIGFGKTVEHNVALLRAGAAGAFDGLERPLLWGISRKSFLGALAGGGGMAQREAAALAVFAVLMEAPHPQIWRVHDVAGTAAALKVWQSLRGAVA